jgi:hypothetical protein
MRQQWAQLAWQGPWALMSASAEGKIRNTAVCALCSDATPTPSHLLSLLLSNPASICPTSKKKQQHTPAGHATPPLPAQQRLQLPRMPPPAARCVPRRPPCTLAAHLRCSPVSMGRQSPWAGQGGPARRAHVSRFMGSEPAAQLLLLPSGWMHNARPGQVKKQA